MKFRVARHTDRLEEMISFYTENLGLHVLGNFEDHDSYDGVFLGKENADWHLEFTRSESSADHKFDEDDLLVFYCDTQAEFDKIVDSFKKNEVQTVTAKNPYWKQNGKTYLDPDGYRIIISTNKISF